MTPDDDALLLSARHGDRAALESLLARHQDQIYRFGMKMCRDPEDAKEVLQDTLLALARGIRDFRGSSSMSTWLYKVARSYCIKKRRKSKFAPQQESSLDADASAEASRLPDPARGADDALAGKEVARALERAIAALEADYREVLVLRDVEGLTAAEVAEVLGISVDAVKSRLHRARLSVRARIAPLLEVPSVPSSAPATGCPDVLQLFSQHMEDEISGEVCARMEEHLRSCPRCQGACDTLKRTLALCSTMRPEKVPASVQDSVRAALRGIAVEP